MWQRMEGFLLPPVFSVAHNGHRPSSMALGTVAHTCSFGWLKTETEALPTESLVTGNFHLLGMGVQGEVQV
jgi:hypothetical protein